MDVQETDLDDGCGGSARDTRSTSSLSDRATQPVVSSFALSMRMR